MTHQTPTKLHIDLETYSPVDLKKCGVYRYAEEAEIIMLQYAFDDEPITVVSVLEGEEIPEVVLTAIRNPDIKKFAFNANFERTIIKACLGIYCPPEEWHCTMVHATTVGLPGSLDSLSDVMKLGDKAKHKTGKALIKLFCAPCKPTKANGKRTRNLPEHKPQEWAEFKAYGAGDVEAEREIERRLTPYPILESEHRLWCLDQRINDYGIEADLVLVGNAIKLAAEEREQLMEQARELTGLANPNSRPQLLKWLLSEGVYTNTLTKKDVEQLRATVGSENVLRMLELRAKISVTSVSKYEAVARSVCRDGRVRGMFQFNGAGRTARWAGRILQPQNLPSKGLIKDIPFAREVLKSEVYAVIRMLYEDVPQVLKSTIRPILKASEGKTCAVADFSAIEGRITAWLAHEEWRLELFARGGWLYEESAAKMFHLPVESIAYLDNQGKKQKGPNWVQRQKGKVAELALGYQGWEGALITMGALEMGLQLDELAPLAMAWRDANPAIVAYWGACEKAALRAMRSKGVKIPVRTDYQTNDLVHYLYDGHFLFCILPSGRRMAYAMPKVATNDRGRPAVSFMGVDGTTKRWTKQWLYGGLMTENQAQAIARDCLKETMLMWQDENRAPIVLHVHDELVLETDEATAEEDLEVLIENMAISPEWAEGLLLKGEGYLTPFYVKDDD